MSGLILFENVYNVKLKNLYILMVNKLDLQALLFLPSIRCFERTLQNKKEDILFYSFY